MNTCPKCGFECDDDDLFCSKCGTKLYEYASTAVTQDTNQLKLFDDFAQAITTPPKSSQNDEFSFSKMSVFDNSILNFVVYIALASFVLIGISYFSLSFHEKKQLSLRYRNLVNNPKQIPELKEPSSLSEFITNLSGVEDFLYLYLSFSNNSIERKEQIFSAYLDEMDKLPHITNETLLQGDKDSCNKITSPSKAKFCTAKVNKQLKNAGVKVYEDNYVLYFYPDNKFIKNKYSKFFNSDFLEYVSLRAKYDYPVSLGVDLYIKPKLLADKIYDYEKLLSKTDDDYLKERIQEELFYDFKKFIFAPSVFETTTHEMQNEYEKAYKYFISHKNDSLLKPLVMSYLDKQKFYTDENFAADYPYKIISKTFEENVSNMTLNDVFAQLRKTIFSSNQPFVFEYVYNMQTGRWSKYDKNYQVQNNEFVMSAPDENNNVSLFNSKYSLLQELNILKYSELFLVNNELYTFNKDKLSISKVMFNGKIFVIRNLSPSDMLSVFPWAEVINLDSYSSYNILIEKDNPKATYIILSRYSQGFASYALSISKGNVENSLLPNMFTVNTSDETVLSFHKDDTNPEQMNEQAPSYKIIIRTRGYSVQKNYEKSDYINYDEQTASDESDEKNPPPNIMPKIINTKQEEENLSVPIPAPTQNIEPPVDGD